jgi:hypothetical protein
MKSTIVLMGVELIDEVAEPSKEPGWFKDLVQ